MRRRSQLLRRQLVAVALATALGGGCSASTHTSSTARSDGPSAASTTAPRGEAGGAQGTTGTSPSNGDDALPPADLHPLLEHLDVDGRLDASGAQAGFDLAFRQSPQPVGDVLDGSGPLRWMLSVWDDLPKAEQDAVSAVLDGARDPFVVDDLDARVAPGTAPLPNGRGRLRGRHRPAEPVLETPACVRYESEVALDPVPAEVEPFVSTYLAMNDEFETQLHRSAVAKLGLCSFTSTQVTSAVFGRVFGIGGDPASAADHCVVYVNPDKAAGLDGAELAMRLGYAALQCFVATAKAGATVDEFYTDARGAWYIEGAAMWATSVAATTVVGGTGGDLDEWWDSYLLHPATPLTERLYDAFGFFAQVESAENVLWARLDRVFASRSTPEAWAAAQTTGDLRDTWASGYFRDPNRSGWDIDGPGITDASFDIATVTVANDTSVPVDSPALAVGVATLEVTADVVHVASAGMLRLSDAQADIERVTDQYFCTRADGDCTCPDGSRPLSEPPQVLGSPIDVGLAGGLKAGTATFAGLTIDEFCNAPGMSWSFAVFQNEAVVPALAGYTCDGLTGTWHVIFGPGVPQYERTYDLAFSSSTTTVHNDLVYDFPPAEQSPAIHVEWRLDYTLDTASEPPAIRVSGTQHETPDGGSEVVFDSNFGTGDGITLENVTLPVLLADRGYAHPFLDQAANDCG